eukprot:1180764-Rhodomonas_salina.2
MISNVSVTLWFQVIAVGSSVQIKSIQLPIPVLSITCLELIILVSSCECCAVQSKVSAWPTMTVTRLVMQVHFTEEIEENKPKVVYLPVISLSDRSFTAQIEVVPAASRSDDADADADADAGSSKRDSGGLYHLIGIDCDAETLLEQPAVSGCSDVGAVYPYCTDDRYSNMVVESADGTGEWAFEELELQVKVVTCTDLEVYDGWAVAKGVNDTAELCSSFINKTSNCVFHLNATCACPHLPRCLEPFFLPFQKQLLAYRLKPDPAYTALAALTGNFFLLEWLLDLGATVHPPTMEIAAASGNVEMVNLLLARRNLWTKHAIIAVSYTHLRAHETEADL